MTRKICTKAALIARFSLFYLFYRARNADMFPQVRRDPPLIP